LILNSFFIILFSLFGDDGNNAVNE